MMERRKYLATISATVGGLTLAGCSGDSDNGGDGGNGGGDSTPTSTPDPVSQLSVYGETVVSEDEEGLIARIQAINPTDQSATAEFSLTYDIADNRGTLTSESSEETVPSGGDITFNQQIIEFDNIDWINFTGDKFYGGTQTVNVNGEPQSETCFESDLNENTSEGCEFYGYRSTHVEVEYSGDWQGSAGSAGNTRTVSRGSITFGAPQGEDTSYILIPEDANIVSANAQKQDDSSEELTIRIVHEREVIAEQSTSSGYGLAQVSETL
jgi:hypothetical protein